MLFKDHIRFSIRDSVSRPCEPWVISGIERCFHDIITLYTTDFTPTPSLVKYNLYQAQRSNTYTVWQEILRIGDFLCFAGTNFCDYDRLVSSGELMFAIYRKYLVPKIDNIIIFY